VGIVKEAQLWEPLDDQQVRCHLCAHGCRIAEGKTGICQVRLNQNGQLKTRAYGLTIAQHIDPVEKKPLLHFYPGTDAYSIATPGCNFRCRWCQNWEISQNPQEMHFAASQKATPQEIVAAAENANCRSIAYTYTEPTIFFEYSYGIAQLAHERDIANLYVTNGYMTTEMLERMAPYLDAANVDLKAFRDETYRQYVGARLQPVLDSLKTMHALGIWLEVTTLVIPHLNDDPDELRDAATFIVEELGPETPWHISRYHPTYQMTDRPATPPETLRRAQEIGKEVGLRHVYVGNLPGESNTVCHECGERLIRRYGYQIMSNRISDDGTCPHCGTPVAGVGMAGS
jgi:pyruvate formate lyase activating enzyme